MWRLDGECDKIRCRKFNGIERNDFDNVGYMGLYMKTIAASNAALKANANGIVDGCENDFTLRERESWTYDMQTDDQVILATAKMANEYAADMMTKSQEIAITDNTNIGITETVNGVESATVDEDKDKNRIWTVTAFSQDGIISKRFQNGKELDGWEIRFMEMESKVDNILTTLNDLKEKAVQKMYNTKELAEYLKIGIETIEKLRQNGELAYAKFGRTYVYTQDDVDNLIKNNHITFVA